MSHWWTKATAGLHDRTNGQLPNFGESPDHLSIVLLTFLVDSLIRTVGSAFGSRVKYGPVPQQFHSVTRLGVERHTGRACSVGVDCLGVKRSGVRISPARRPEAPVFTGALCVSEIVRERWKRRESAKSPRQSAERPRRDGRRQPHPSRATLSVT